MLKFQAVAEKTAKNFRALFFCRTLYMVTSTLTLTLTLVNDDCVAYFMIQLYCNVYV